MNQLLSLQEDLEELCEEMKNFLVSSKWFESEKCKHRITGTSCVICFDGAIKKPREGYEF